MQNMGGKFARHCYILSAGESPMNNSNLAAALFLVPLIAFQAAAQPSQAVYSVSGDLTAIYTLGNAADDQLVGENGAGAYFSDPASGIIAKKNGFYTAANVYTRFSPFPWLEGYFKLYAVSRNGSFYLPLQMENNDVKDFTKDLTIDMVYGRVSVFNALGLQMPVDLFVKAGKYKAQASNYGTISRYGTEDALYTMNIKNDFTYELGVDFESPFKLSASAAANYRLTEAVQRYYDEDGGMGLHGNAVPGKFAPQLIAMIKLRDFGDMFSAELLYGNNVFGSYSGHAAGFSARYTLRDITDGLSIPIGLSFGFYEKNIDLLGRAAILPGANEHTMSFRNAWSAGLGTGIRFSRPELFDLDFNLGGGFSSIRHYYRTDLAVFKLSLDAVFTWQRRFFAGGGFVAGTLTDAEWKTRDDVDITLDNNGYDHTFTFAENCGYEVYAGINLNKNGKIVIGFNQNKGLSLNHMLEAKTEGQIKYKQAGTEWNTSNKLVEAGGLYFKCVFRF
jgi:hypothetical protein